MKRSAPDAGTVQRYRCTWGPIGVGAYAVPSLHLASWSFTGNAQG